MIKDLHVLHVLNSASGGAALSTLGLIAELQKQGIESSAVCHDAGVVSERNALTEATRGRTLFTSLYWWNRKIRAPLWRRPFMELKQRFRTGNGRKSAEKVAQFAQQHRAGLIHTNTFTTPEGGLAARQLGLPHVWHIRELVGRGQPYPLKWSGSRLTNFVRRHCSKLVANSQACAEVAREWAPEGMLEIVPNGIDLSQISPRSASSRGGPIILGMVGSLTSHVKKHALLIEAVGKLPAGIDFEVRIFGHDPSCGGTQQADRYIADLHKRIEALGLKSKFRWPGFITDVNEIMSQIDILVHPTELESFGRVAVEAMAAGLPVVGVKGGGVGEIVQDEVTGLLARANDPTDLARQVERLLRQPMLRETFGQAGRERAEKNYSLAACAAGIARVYAQAMQSPLTR